MDSFRKGDGGPVELGNELSRGGEGIIYEVPSEPNSVAKIWRDPNELQARKLEILLRNPPTLPEGAWQRLEVAWPTDALYDEQNVMRGYLMPRVPTDQFHELVRFCIPAARRILESGRGTQFTRHDLLTIARNLCESFSVLHEAGYVIGDVNHTNFLVRPDGKVFVIDLDSVQATDPETGEVQRCTVGKEDFTPPRLVGQRFEDVDRTTEDDLFGLAVLVFQILMNGSHPYDPVDQSGGQGQVRQENIRRGHSPYVNLDVIQARAVLDLENIPDEEIREQQRRNILALIGLGATADFDTVLGPRMSSWLELEPVFRDMFSRAFGDEENGRPESGEWVGAVDSILVTLQPVAPAPAPATTPAPPAPQAATTAAPPVMRPAPQQRTQPPRSNPPPQRVPVGAAPPTTPPTPPAGQYFASASGGGSGKRKWIIGASAIGVLGVIVLFFLFPGYIISWEDENGLPTKPPIPASTSTPAPDPTPAPTATPAPPTPTLTPPTPEPALTPDPTPTPEPTVTPVPTPPTPTPTYTPTPASTPPTPTPTYTPTPTPRMPTITPTYTPTPTPTRRPPTPTYTPTPTPTPRWVWRAYENSQHKYTFRYEQSWELTDGLSARGRPWLDVAVKDFRAGESIAGFFERHRQELLSQAMTYAAFSPGLTKGETFDGRNYVHMEYLWQPSANDCLYHVVEHIFRSRYYPERNYGFIIAAGICENQLTNYAGRRENILLSFEETE